MSIALPGNTPNTAGASTTPSGGSYTTITSTHANSHGAAVAYGLNTNFSGKVSQADWQNIINTAKAENNRRSGTVVGGTVTTTTTIKAGDWNAIVTAFNVSDSFTDSSYNNNGTLSITTTGPTAAPFTLPAGGYPLPSPPPGRSITAALANTLTTALNAAGAVCTCNCNYCTCNCNYCTCNCNYACTCNCNYSDIRLKENVEFVEEQRGLNIYSWNYVWDKHSTYRGVLAHELLGTQYSCALTLDPAGYYMVDYNQLPVEMSKE